MSTPGFGFRRQSIDQFSVDAIASVLRSDVFTQGPGVECFESVLAEQVGTR